MPSFITLFAFISALTLSVSAYPGSNGYKSYWTPQKQFKKISEGKDLAGWTKNDIGSAIRIPHLSSTTEKAFIFTRKGKDEFLVLTKDKVVGTGTGNPDRIRKFTVDEKGIWFLDKKGNALYNIETGKVASTHPTNERQATHETQPSRIPTLNQLNQAKHSDVKPATGHANNYLPVNLPNGKKADSTPWVVGALLSSVLALGLAGAINTRTKENLEENAQDNVFDAQRSFLTTPVIPVQ